MPCTLVALCALAGALNASAPIYAARALQLDRAASMAGLSTDQRSDLDREIALEEKLDAMLLGRQTPGPLTTGDNELVVGTPSGADAAAVYIPPPSPQRSYSLVVLLHGRSETETDVVSRSVFRRLADREEAILYAPFAGGSDRWGSDAEASMLSMVDTLTARFGIPPERCYLAGISMGGAGVFRIASAHSERFAAFMSIIGYLNLDDASTLGMRLRTKTVYLVEGAADPIMAPHAYADTGRALDALRVNYGIYLSPKGVHSIASVSSSIERAWDDMFAGIVRRVSEPPAGV